MNDLFLDQLFNIKLLNLNVLGPQMDGKKAECHLEYHNVVKLAALGEVQSHPIIFESILPPV